MKLCQFLNTKIENTGYLSAIGDAGLAPARALLNGKTYEITVIEGSSQAVVEQDSPTNKLLVIAMVITGLFLILPLFKLMAACFSDVREKHEIVQASQRIEEPNTTKDFQNLDNDDIESSNGSSDEGWETQQNTTNQQPL